MDDRIEALLSDVEAMHASREAHARRGELSDEVAVHAAQRTLLERMRGAIGQPVQVVVAAREISGTAVFLGDGIFVIAGIEATIVTIDWIREIRTRSRRHRYETGPLERLGMASALRRLASDHEEISLELAGEGGAIRGRSDMVASDYIEISGRIIPHRSIALVQARVNPFA
ncbi:hypothetical protein [Brevibacterium antiquum]|uniref:Uncharacterized protein n=2 Tax=Brevibacterium antiquum TaxID=234835 RepID=A0A2H1JN92_9MICO|nr:hypothetical protein [Brevibacterium antiquum]SMX78368.1 hypothetical protein BANT10_01255 [Brevibacterium antiquum]SMX88891.1 hypothetical protein BANT918_01703 [Brevibacterium antiquum CNRZ 918]